MRAPGTFGRGHHRGDHCQGGSALKREGILLVISGPSGVGKGTVIERLQCLHPGLACSVSCTTRHPRPDEVNGRDYHFVTAERFSEMLAHDELLEWATVHGDTSYGTPRGPVEQALSQGRDIILEIDFQGARSVREKLGERAVLVFIAPPTWEALHSRLVGRKTEKPSDVERRLETARLELAHIDLFEYLVINDQIADTVAQLDAILRAERTRRSRLAWEAFQAELLADAGER